MVCNYCKKKIAINSTTCEKCGLAAQFKQKLSSKVEIKKSPVRKVRLTKNIQLKNHLKDAPELTGNFSTKEQVKVINDLKKSVVFMSDKFEQFFINENLTVLNHKIYITWPLKQDWTTTTSTSGPETEKVKTLIHLSPLERRLIFRR